MLEAILSSSLAETEGQDYQLVVRVFADAEKLAESSSVQGAQSIEQLDYVRDFVAGFNGASSSFEFVDVKTGSEGVFDKIRGMNLRNRCGKPCANVF